MGVARGTQRIEERTETHHTPELEPDISVLRRLGPRPSAAAAGAVGGPLGRLGGPPAAAAREPVALGGPEQFGRDAHPGADLAGVRGALRANQRVPDRQDHPDGPQWKAKGV